MSKHTPGPWVINTFEGTHYLYKMYQQNCIAKITPHKEIDAEEAAANAALIAAAPRYRAALEEMAKWCTRESADEPCDCIPHRVLEKK